MSTPPNSPRQPSRPLEHPRVVVGWEGPREPPANAAMRRASRRGAGTREQVRVLVISDAAEWCKRARECLGAAGIACVCVGTLGAAKNILETNDCGSENTPPARFDGAIVDANLPDGRGLDIITPLCAAGLGVVFADAGASVDSLVAAVRAGASDAVDPARVGAAELIERVSQAAENSRRARRRAERLCALKRLCRRLGKSREQLARQAEALCSDLVQAHQELAMSRLSIASEFKGLIRGELDIEALLRTTLEFVLARSGPTNAAVFLPTTSGDYSLGAYVNYDCPKDTCDVLLDHLANTVAHKFETQIGICQMTSREEVEKRIGDEAQWLGDSGVLAFACRHESETLAVFLLFRDRSAPFTTALMQQLQTVSDLFAAQLARVIHIHHRHLPKDKWGMLGDPPADDYGDLAA